MNFCSSGSSRPLRPLRPLRVLRSLLIAGLFLLPLLAGSCRSHRIIPDDELALIFHDAFLVNARLSHEAKRDSLNVYEPIFARYGYTTADVQYTIGNFSKRKSARLGDVVEQAIALLEQEGTFYDREVAILDTITHIAERTMTRRVYADSAIRVEALKDTARLRIAIDAQPGSYSISVDYHVDSLDRNDRLRNELWYERANGTRVNIVTNLMWKKRDEHFTRTVRTDTTHRRIHLDVGTFDGTPRKPSFTVKEIRIDYTPNAEDAVQQLADEQLRVRIFADAFLGVLMPAAEAEVETDADSDSDSEAGAAESSEASGE